MAKGQVAKQEVMAMILETFADSFLYNDNKEIRINTMEGGEPVQIKVTLTAAKVPVSKGEDTVIPGEKVAAVKGSMPVFESVTNPVPINKVEVTSEERANVQKMLSALNI